MRFAISPVIGNGTTTIVVGSETTTGPYRLKLAEYGPHEAIIPGNADGTPIFNWGLGVFYGDAAQIAAADADTQIDVLPDLTLDHVLTAGERNWLTTRLTNRGLPTGWVTPGITVLQALRTIGRWLENNFDVDWLGVTP